MRGHMALRYGDLINELWSGTAKVIAPLKMRASVLFTFHCLKAKKKLTTDVELESYLSRSFLFHKLGVILFNLFSCHDYVFNISL